MIPINNDAYITADYSGYELFMKRPINEGTDKERYEFEGGQYSSSLAGALNIYVEERLMEIARSKDAYVLNEVKVLIKQLKQEVTELFKSHIPHESHAASAKLQEDQVSLS